MIQKYLRQLNKSLNPSKEQENRVYDKIFGVERGYVTSPSIKFLNFDSMFRNKKFATIGLSVLAIMFVLPFSLFSLGVGRDQKSADVNNAPLARENSETDSPDDEQLAEASKNQLDTLDDYASGANYEVMPDELAISSPSSFRDKQENEDTETLQQNRAVVQDGYIAFDTGDIKNDFNKIKDLASKYDGYIVTSQFSGGDDSTGQVTLRVPASKFQNVIDEIRGFDVTITSENISAQDKQNEITEYTQVTSDLEKQIIELKEKVKNSTDENEKNQLNAQIKTLETSLNSSKEELNELTKETSFSTIDVSLTEVQNFGLLGGVIDNVDDTLNFMVSFWLNAVIVGFVPVLIIVIVYKLIKRNKKK